MENILFYFHLDLYHLVNLNALLMIQIFYSSLPILFYESHLFPLFTSAIHPNTISILILYLRNYLQLLQMAVLNPLSILNERYSMVFDLKIH